MSFCLGFAFQSYAHEVYDVETLPILRTKAYLPGNYKRIVVFSAPRTGSSLIYNVFKFLFEEDSKLSAPHDHFEWDRIVRKTHSFDQINSLDKRDSLCVFTFRHPFYAGISNYRVQSNNEIDYRRLAQGFVSWHYNYLCFSEKMENHGLNILRLKYEEFANNLDALFSRIESYFHFSIDPADKELMRKGYSKANIEACTQDLKDFSVYFPISGFHGQHVGAQGYVPPKEYLLWLKVYSQSVLPLFQKYGY